MISADKDGAITDFTYGLERISAVTDKVKTEYIYDGRGSVAAEVTYNSAWYTLGGAIAKKNVTVKSYTPFGEQIGEAVSGFGFNGEYYDALSGQIYLRARFYEPEMARFGQKDIVRGTITDALSLNRYSYCENDPVNFCDPSGMRMVIDIDAASVASKPKTTTTSTKTSSKPVQSHTSSVNPNNTAKVTSQAVADAKAAMDFANRTAPNNLQAQQARDAYQRTVNNAAIANATNNPSAAMKAVQTSKQAVIYANSSVNATGKPKTTTTNSNTTAPSTSSPTVQSPVLDNGKCGEKAKFALFTNTAEKATSFASFLYSLTKDIDKGLKKAEINRLVDEAISWSQNRILDAPIISNLENAAQLNAAVNVVSKASIVATVVSTVVDLNAQLKCNDSKSEAFLKTALHVAVGVGASALTVALAPSMPVLAIGAAIVVNVAGPELTDKFVDAIDEKTNIFQKIDDFFS